jgi:hypothetical protein
VKAKPQIKLKPVWCVYDAAEWCATKDGKAYSGRLVRSLCDAEVVVQRTLLSKRFRVPDCPKCLAKLRRRATRKREAKDEAVKAEATIKVWKSDRQGGWAWQVRQDVMVSELQEENAVPHVSDVAAHRAALAAMKRRGLVERKVQRES